MEILQTIQYECLAIASQLELESLVLVQGFSEVLQILAIKGLAPGHPTQKSHPFLVVPT